MPSYWPDKPHKPAYRRGLDKILYRLYVRFGLRSRFWLRKWQEHEVRRILQALARQQVYGFVANPEDGKPIWYIDAPEDVQENRYPLNTCLLRGWIEVLNTESQSYEGFPVAQPLIPKGGSIDDFSKPPYYRLTTAGWNALYRAYTLSRMAFAVSLLAFFVSGTSVVIAITNAIRTSPPPLRLFSPHLCRHAKSPEIPANVARILGCYLRPHFGQTLGGFASKLSLVIRISSDSYGQSK